MRYLVILACFCLLLSQKVLAGSEKPQPTGEMLSVNYLSKQSFADALLNFKKIDDKLKVNSTDKVSLWELGLTYFVIANNDKNYLPRCLETWDNYLRLYPNDAFALWNRAFVKHYFKSGNPCSDVQSAVQLMKKKFLPAEPSELMDCLKKKRK